MPSVRALLARPFLAAGRGFTAAASSVAGAPSGGGGLSPAHRVDDGPAIVMAPTRLELVRAVRVLWLTHEFDTAALASLFARSEGEIAGIVALREADVASGDVRRLGGAHG